MKIDEKNCSRIMPKYVRVMQIPHLIERIFEPSEIQVDIKAVLEYAVSGIDEEIKFITREGNIKVFSGQIRDTLLLRDILQAEIDKLEEQKDAKT